MYVSYIDRTFATVKKVRGRVGELPILMSYAVDRYMSSAAIYYNYMRQLKSTLNIEPSVSQPQPQPQLQPQTATDAIIGTIFKVRHDIIDSIVKKNRF